MNTLNILDRLLENSFTKMKIYGAFKALVDRSKEEYEGQVKAFAEKYKSAILAMPHEIETDSDAKDLDEETNEEFYSVVGNYVLQLRDAVISELLKLDDLDDIVRELYVSLLYDAIAIINEFYVSCTKE